MVVLRHDSHNGVMAYILRFGESAIHRIFVVWVVFMKAILTCLNLKVDERFLIYSKSISNWSIRTNDWPNKILNYIYRVYTTVKYLTHVFPDL